MFIKTVKKPETLKNIDQKQNRIILVFSIVTGLMLVSVLVGGFALSYMWRALLDDNNSKLATLIVQAVDDLSVSAPIDAKTGKVYIPQARLLLPMAQDTVGSELEYRYSPAQGDSSEELMVVNTFEFRSARAAIVGAQGAENMFEKVPKFQACARGYQITFQPVAATTNPLKFTKKLSDGRNVYVYIDKDCQQTSEHFDNYLEKIDSY